MTKQSLTIAPVVDKLDIFDAYNLLADMFQQRIYCVVYSLSGKRKRGWCKGKRYIKRYVREMSLAELIGAVDDNHCV